MATSTPQTIHLFRGKDAWMSRFSDPEIRALFGTDTIPTAFTLRADKEMVRSTIARLNPGAVITIED